MRLQQCERHKLSRYHPAFDSILSQFCEVDPNAGHRHGGGGEVKLFISVSGGMWVKRSVGERKTARERGSRGHNTDRKTLVII